MSKNLAEGQFWADEPDPYAAMAQRSNSFLKIFKILSLVLFTLPMLSLIMYLFLIAGTPFLMIYLGLFVLIFLSYFFQSRQRKLFKKRSIEIQQRARERTGATWIDSAIHVAGHPLLNRDQPIVLALKDDNLSFYAYDSMTAIDVLSTKQLQSVNTVVYDDERIPHIDVIDSAAQALQITFTRNGETWTCLFRRMRQLRPIDWYHSIQQARTNTRKEIS